MLYHFIIIILSSHEHCIIAGTQTTGVVVVVVVVVVLVWSCVQVVGPILEDQDFVKWSPSRVWQDETAANSSLSASTSSSLVDVFLPTPDRHRSHDSRGPSPIIATLSLPSVYNSTTHKIADTHPVEVLGPAEYIWGHPIRVKVDDTGAAGTPTKCRVLTMLYRR